jgi:twitching motility protein PilT
MRDFETINAAITAAETGHLVMSTLHTTDAATTIDRIIDVFPGHQQRQIRTQLASVLVGIACQTLIPRLDNTGRIACLEILNVTDAISAMIRDDKVHLIETAIQTGKTLGMQSRDQELARLVKEKIISLEDALDRCSSSEELNRFLNTR